MNSVACQSEIHARQGSYNDLFTTSYDDRHLLLEALSRRPEEGHLAILDVTETKKGVLLTIDKEMIKRTEADIGSIVKFAEQFK